MKKTKKILSLIVVFVLLISASVVSFSADTIYIVNGYSYSVVNNTSISLVDWDHEQPNLSVPDMLANRYFISVANWAFENDTDLKSVDLSRAEHLNRIGMYAFSGCTEIEGDLVIPQSVTRIGEHAFDNCNKLETLEYNGSADVPEYCFYNCSSLKSVSIAEGAKSISYFAFANCSNLEYAEIPQSVTSIAASAFRNDSNLTLGVWYGTTGYDYAIVQNIPYVLLDGIKLGDTTGDGIVNINDVTTIQRYLAELEPLEGIYLHAADANQDGTVDIADATALQMYIAEYDLPYPIGEVMTQ